MSIANGTTTRIVEYFRCWTGNDMGSGTWDTGFVAIPADTPEESLDDAVRRAVARVPWEDKLPLLVGFFADDLDFDIGGEG